MDPNNIILKLERNAGVFRDLLRETSRDEYLWKYEQEKWCLLQIVCHLYDEEKEDFRTRLKFAVESSITPPPPIDPVGWVASRNYIKQDFVLTLDNFLNERKHSIDWLYSLPPSVWDNTFEHPTMGKVSAGFFLANWLAHDYLHIRQIIKVKYLHLKISSDEDLNYAGEW